MAQDQVKKEVLIVEDDRALASSLERAVNDEGYAVRVVHDGQAALGAIRVSRPGLVLLDLLLPKRDGSAVLRELREAEATRGLPVVVMTGVFRGREHQRELQQAGANAFLEKPFRKSDLAPHLRRHLGRPGNKPGQISTAAGERYALAETSIAEVLWIAMRDGVTGAVVFESGKRRKTVVLHEGKPISIRSNIARECLGNRLLAAGRIETRALQESLKRSRAGEGMQGEILVKLGAISQAQLDKALAEQARDKLLDLFAWNDGEGQIQREPQKVSLASSLPDWTPREVVLRGVQLMSPKRVERLLSPYWDEPVLPGDVKLSAREKAIPEVAAVMSAIEEGPRLGAAAAEHPAVFFGLRLVGAVRFGESDSGHALTTAGEGGSGAEDELQKLLEKMEGQSHFEVLGLEQDTSEAQVRAAFVKLAKTYHPDRYSDAREREVAADVFARIAGAHETLSQSESRQQYLNALKSGRTGGDGAQVNQIVTAEVQFQKGQALFRGRDYAAALQHFEWAIQVNPDEGEFQSLYGWAYYLVNHAEANAAGVAKQHLERGIELSPKSTNGYYYLGLFRKACEDLPEAGRMFRKVMELDPKHQDASRELRLLSMRQEKSGGGRGLFGFGKKKR